MLRFCIVAAFVAIVVRTPAQGGQTGDVDRDYVINGAGSQESSLRSSRVVPGLEDFINEYRTSSAFAPVVWVMGTTGTIDWVPNLQANSVDVGPQGLQALVDGTQPGFPGSFIRTAATGEFDLRLPMDPALAGTTVMLAMAHFTPASPDGFFISQTHQVAFAASPAVSCQPGAMVVTPGQVMNLGFGFPFYGQMRNQIVLSPVGAGIEFSTTPGLLVPWDAILWTMGFNVPAVCAYCGFGMNYGMGETVTFFTDGQGFAEVCWSSFAGPAGEQNWVRLGLFLTQGQPTVFFEYGLLGTLGDDGPIVVGLNPGLGNAGVIRMIDLSAKNSTFTSQAALPFEMFGQQLFGPFPTSGPSDLRFNTLFWNLDFQGFPLIQN